MNTRTTCTFAPALLLGGLLFLTACDSNDEPEGLDLGRFETEITGTVEMSLEGLAGFTTEIDPEAGDYFSIALISDEDNEDVVLLVGRGNPAERAYTLTTIEPEEAEGETGGIVFLRTTGDDGAMYISEEGTLTLTDVSSDRLEGRFEFTAVSPFDEDDVLSLQGSFNARTGDETGERALITR